MSALGFIETKGLLAAIEGADAMLKAADVTLLEKNLVGGGLVTITVAGEVSAVEASVDAGITAIKRISGSVLHSHNVIARHYDELERIITTCVPVPETGGVEATEQTDLEAKTKVEEVPESESSTQTEEVESAPKVAPIAPVKTEAPEYKISELKKMKISRIRQIARNLSGIYLTHDEIKKAPKKTLIEIITNVTRQIEE
ncbi:BMC domain-containing protein [Maridesulfovibrio zosterae]|uniref:BMC domain-containing protein n=1 Tax=Maridesulfovibrio zosterae TaxID=82171 RepID=UPI00040C59F1|nr:BMC domain-containing protein [Maridesulfovibrio zosterae]